QYISPVDTTKFGKSYATPKLGGDQSLCGTSGITLNSQVPTDGKKRFTWILNTTTVVNRSLTQNTFLATAAGVYTCVLDSNLIWSTQDQITISGSLPGINLGSNITLCNPAFATLDAVVTGTGFSYQWAYSPNFTFASLANEAGQTGRVYSNIRKRGLFRVTVAASGCTSVWDTITIYSNLPTPVDACIQSAGIANLAIANPGLNGTNYGWYASSSSGTVLSTGTSYNPSVSSTTTYWVQDLSSQSGSVGPTSAIGTGTNWGVSAGNQMLFSITQDITVNSFKVSHGNIYSNGGATITVEILDGSGNSFTPAKSFTSNSTNVTTAMANTLITYSFTGFNILSSWGNNLRIR
ncbi:MAG: hypothetical protein K2Q22_14090, partial [Cytophagales bacterium]|nr:hypothetical protein [Cytophagales bacterium]